MNTTSSRPQLCIAAAQAISVANDVARNVQTHLAFAREAAQQGVQLLVFPELSLTGYELPQLAARVLDEDGMALAPLRQAVPLVSEKGYGPESAQLQAYTREHAMAVLPANHSGTSGGYASAGHSAFWAPGGHEVAAAPGPGQCLVVATRTADGEWSGCVVPLDLAA